MWGKPRTFDRVGDDLRPPFPAWVTALDTNLAGIENNGIYDAFRRRAAYHKLSLRRFLSVSSLQRTNRATIFACLFLCWPVGLALLALSFVARGLGPKLGQPLGEDQRASIPDRIGLLIQQRGIMVPECTDLWLTGANGRDFARALYAEMRQGTGWQARVVQVVLGVLPPTVYISILYAMKVPREVLSPCFWLFLATTAWTVVQIAPYSVLSGMNTVAEELDNRRRILNRVVTKRAFWQLDPDIVDQFIRLLKVGGTVAVMFFSLYVAICSFGTLHDAWKQSQSPVLRNVATHSAGLAATMLITLGNLWMAHRIRNRSKWVEEIASRLNQIGDDFELALVVNLGSGPEEVAHWMAARRAAGRESVE